MSRIKMNGSNYYNTKTAIIPSVSWLLPPLPGERSSNKAMGYDGLVAPVSAIGSEAQQQAASVMTESTQEGQGDNPPNGEQIAIGDDIEPASAGSDNERGDDVKSLVDDFWKHPFRLEVDLKDPEWLPKITMQYVLHYSMKRGMPFNTTKNLLLLLSAMNILKEEVNMTVVQSAVDSNSTEALNSLKLRTCPRCGKDSIAPYIFCQNCLSEHQYIRLIQSCQVPSCLANNRTAYELLKEEQLLKNSNVTKPKRMRKGCERTREMREKVMKDGFKMHCHDTCVHSRTTSSAEECVFESLVGVLGDLIKNGMYGLLKHTTPGDSLDHIKKAIAGEWVSSASSYNRCQCYDKFNMREHALCIARRLDELQKQGTTDDYLSEGVQMFTDDNSPEKRMGLGSNAFGGGTKS